MGETATAELTIGTLQGVRQIALRPKAMAAALDVSERTLFSWRKSKNFPTKEIEGVVIHPVDQVKEWLSQQ